ncbi:helix-turn-helix domain-containing protein [Streptomyces sp. NPDC051130]|uniref:MmyB family transcriptional regulator n=1 Tax=Streptomyces sp. NPDC051130 TaxID=3157223 RepID=UPI0034130558
MHTSEEAGRGAYAQGGREFSSAASDWSVPRRTAFGLAEDESEANQADADLAAGMRARRIQQLLKGRRDHLDLSQEDVASRLNISGRSYGNWERGRVKEWTDLKLYQLAEALEMSPFQTYRLFWYAVDRAPQSDIQAMFRRDLPMSPSTSEFLGDYGVMINALSLPSLVIDQQWNVRMTNKAYRELFRDVPAHPTAMPSDNFLRFGLFHPGAPAVLADHAQWQLAMLAQLSSSLERNDEDSELRAIRREVYLDPMLRDIYLKDLPDWVLGCGADLIHHEGALRELRHPDPEIGLQGCRLVEETPRSLRALGLTRITLVLVDPDDTSTTSQARSLNSQTGTPSTNTK